jgi:hypothetical protein
MNGSIVVTNRQTKPIVVRMEPWAWETTLAPGQSADVDYKADQGGDLEIHVGDGEIVLYGWEGSAFSDWRVRGLPKT